MTRSEFLAGRLREVLLDGHWIANTNFKDQLLSVNWIQATQKTGNLNTIAALTFHINYYLAGLIHAFESGKLVIRDRYSFDLPAIQDEEGWQKLLNCFLNNAAGFISLVSEMPDERLDSVFIDEKYGTCLRNIEGVIEHSYYHLGQISLIRKLISEPSGS